MTNSACLDCGVPTANRHLVCDDCVAQHTRVEREAQQLPPAVDDDLVYQQIGVLAAGPRDNAEAS